VRDEIEKTAGFAGTGGLVTMSPEDHLGLNAAAFHMIEIRGGKWKLAD
jgi:branched-chain amino acid transport system substrate-binding protein